MSFEYDYFLRDHFRSSDVTEVGTTLLSFRRVNFQGLSRSACWVTKEAFPSAQFREAHAGWDLGSLFAQLGNLADHYRTAEPLARRFFAQDLQIAFLIAAGGLALLRMPSFLRRLDRRLNEGDSANA